MMRQKTNLSECVEKETKELKDWEMVCVEEEEEEEEVKRDRKRREREGGKVWGGEQEGEEAR